MAYSVVMDDQVNERAVHGRSPTGEMNDTVIASMVLATIFFFFVANEVVRLVAQRYDRTRILAEWSWARNLGVSWIHADFCTCWILYLWFGNKDKITELSDLFFLQPPASYYLVAFSTGYFLYDMFDLGREGKLFKNWEVTVHHITVLTIFIYHLVYHFALGFVVLALVVEINSVFLHGRKLMQIMKVPFQHPFYRAITLINLVTFVIFRGGPLLGIWVGFYMNTNLISWFHCWLLGAAMLFMSVLNPVLFWRLLRSDLLRGRKKAEKKEEDKNCNKVADEKRNGGVLTKREGAEESMKDFIKVPHSSNGVTVVLRQQAS